MSTDVLAKIDKQINELIEDKVEHSFESLKQKVETILGDVDMFMVDDQLNSKAVDLYVKKVITKRNELQKQTEQSKLNDLKQTKYTVIEAICKKGVFETQEALIETIEKLEKKSLAQLREMLHS